MTSRPLQWMAWSALIVAAAGCDAATSARESSTGERAASAARPPAYERVPPSSATSPQPQPTVSAEPPAPASNAPAPSASEPSRTVEVKLPDPDSSGYIETTFDDLKFEMTKTELFDRAMLTPKVNALMDKKIRIRGYIFPTLRKTGLNRIVLVRDNMECCFGPGAALFDCVLVTMAPGKTAEYSIRPVAVEGTIRLEELQGGPDGRPLAIYQMVGDKVE
ncbi:DUF3299 domain-containing protein [Lacipirellula limnantheis]|uniref:DUF3299 domain-containing protein n=1 Tax=Lacipirellula limnantheis TaxID=2528024 RepID=A0A517TU88_9BACT|nr:DUF3299 domain-containing protein [Lacipirellula limnantheis]QDT71936.1 hypothetical protein I41_10980 [Lacipirellula limnantheis]